MDRNFLELTIVVSPNQHHDLFLLKSGCDHRDGDVNYAVVVGQWTARSSGRTSSEKRAEVPVSTVTANGLKRQT
jgi:hypothetical protein